MKAKVVAKTDACVIVKVGKKREDRYMSGCPFWSLAISGEIGDVVEFERGDIVACSPTLEQAKSVFGGLKRH
jgi:hypothetical protein